MMRRTTEQATRRAPRILAFSLGLAMCACATLAMMTGVAPSQASATPTGSAVAMVPPTGPGAPIGFQLFPADNSWNTDISALPVERNSAAYLASIGLSTGLHPDFGTVWDGAPIGIPYVVVRGTQPKVPITFYYADESDPGPYPIPLGAPIEGGASSDGDRHVLTLDVDNHILYEVYDAHYDAATGSWTAGSGAIWHLDSNALRPDGWTSADAAGLPILPGLVRYDEVQAGEITHALRFTVPRTQRAYVYPATHYASSSTDPSLPPMGLRVRLKANYDVSGFPAEVQVILRALKRYGMIVADNGSAWYVSGAPDSRWNDDALHAISQVKGSDFEVVETTGTAALPQPPAAAKPLPPIVSLGSAVRSRAKHAFSRWGRFSDSAAKTWTATVNYGDGHGTKRLSFSRYKRFLLKHTYARKGTYTLVVKVRSDLGVTGVSRLKVVVRK
ncbi:MAG: PKD domain-containing protein [Coriobacteriia bacterium]|nr:PKD domain-containing protein [Coriobacteriia bacterium]